MYQIGETVWSVVYPFDIPKKTTIINVNSNFSNTGGLTVDYTVQYKNREFNVRNYDVYPTQIEAEIYWSVLTLQDYENTLSIRDLFDFTDDYEIAVSKAKKLMDKYTETHPDLILKYL